jgi:hypothetical protein
MLRSSLIVLIASLMVTDPYLCAVAEAAVECVDEQPGACCEHKPADSHDDSCSSCLCRGATPSRDHDDVVTVSCLSGVIEPPTLSTTLRANYYTHVRRDHLGHPPSGRRVRILLESPLA